MTANIKNGANPLELLGYRQRHWCAGSGAVLGVA
jgi:hypothetical protein